MRARRTLRKADRGAAIRAVHTLDIPSKLVELLGRQRPDEVFFAQEIEEGREASVPVRAAAVTETCVALHVLRVEQARAADGAFHYTPDRAVPPGQGGGDDGEQRERRCRCQPRAFTGVEPERLTGVARVDVDAPAEMIVQRVDGHRVGAVRAIHCMNCASCARVTRHCDPIFFPFRSPASRLAMTSASVTLRSFAASAGVRTSAGPEA